MAANLNKSATVLRNDSLYRRLSEQEISFFKSQFIYNVVITSLKMLSAGHGSGFHTLHIFHIKDHEILASKRMKQCSIGRRKTFCIHYTHQLPVPLRQIKETIKLIEKKKCTLYSYTFKYLIEGFV